MQVSDNADSMESGDAFHARLPARITGIVFWGLVLVGLLIAVFVLTNAEVELHERHRSNARMLAYELEGIIEKNARKNVLVDAQDKLRRRINSLKTDMGFTYVLLESDGSRIVAGESRPNDDVFPFTISFYPRGSNELQLVTMLAGYPNHKEVVDDIRKNTLLFIGLTVVLFGLLLQQILHRILSGPFLKMVRTAQRFTDGDETLRFDENRQDEFGYLGKFINNALESVLESQQDIKAALLRAERSEIELSEEKELAEVTLHSINDAVITVHPDGVIFYINPSAEHLFGVSRSEAAGRHFNELVNMVNELSGEHVEDMLELCFNERRTVKLPEHTSVILRNTRPVAIEASIAPMKNNESELIGAVIVIQDVSNTRKLTRQLSYQASHDMLTGLYNRLKFEEHIKNALEQCRKDDSEHSMCYLDLDQFKIVNDTCGHVAGDELLRQLPEILHKVLRSRDIIARLGGDEFGVLLEDCDIRKATDIADKIRHEIRDFRFVWEDKTFTIGVSIGLVAIDRHTRNLAQIMSHADLACYAAKDSGRNRVHIYEPSDEMVSERHGEMHWTGRIMRAMEEDRFRIYCQPILAIGSDTASHYEILVRMIDENGKVTPPGSFMPAAERYNLMSGIDRWVIHEVFQLMSSGDAFRWGRDNVVSINLSGDSLSDETMLEFIVKEKETFGIDMHGICFEITETVAITNLSKAAVFISELKKYGCRFSLDDFGSGLSSFAYLKTLPVDYLKIDGSFVKDVSRDAIDRAMVISIQQMGEAMSLETIAEWVEDEETLEVLTEIGVDYVQGYHLGMPEPIETKTRPQVASL